MGTLDETSQAIGRIEGTLQGLVAKVDETHNIVTKMQTEGCAVGQANSCGKTKAVVWGGGAAAVIASIVEAIRQVAATK